MCAVLERYLRAAADRQVDINASSDWEGGLGLP